jgi:hypothetical protein
MFTGLLIAALIIAGVGAAAGTGFAVARRRRALGSGSRRQLTAGSLQERTIRELRVGDVIQYGPRDFLVEGVIEYDEDGHRWVGGRVVDGAEEKWVVAGMERIGTRKSLRWLELDTENELSGYPPETLLVGGTRYSLDKRGTATARFFGDLGDVPRARGQGTAERTVERCRWWRYEAAGDETLIVEQWGGEYRTMVGKHLTEGVLEMIPGS